jgi:hypothetical protein
VCVCGGGGGQQTRSACQLCSGYILAQGAGVNGDGENSNYQLLLLLLSCCTVVVEQIVVRKVHVDGSAKQK